MRCVSICVLAIGFLAAAGCKRGRPSESEAYLKPTPSPLAETAAARRLLDFLPDRADPQDEYGTAGESYTGVRPGVFTFQVDREFFLPSRDAGTCEGAADRYLADLARRCEELGGSFARAEVRRGDGGFVASARYTLPGRTGEVGVSVQTVEGRPTHPIRVAVSVTEDADAQEKPK